MFTNAKSEIKSLMIKIDESLKYIKRDKSEIKAF